MVLVPFFQFSKSKRLGRNVIQLWVQVFPRFTIYLVIVVGFVVVVLVVDGVVGEVGLN